MKIYNNNYYDKKLYANNKSNKKDKTLDKDTKAIKNNNGDRIELSLAGTKLKSYIDKIEKLDKTRLNKIEDIKSKIQNGKYKVSSEELSEKIIDKLSNDDTFKGE